MYTIFKEKKEEKTIFSVLQRIYHSKLIVGLNKVLVLKSNKFFPKLVTHTIFFNSLSFNYLNIQ